MQLNKIWNAVRTATFIVWLALPLQACSANVQYQVDAILDSMIYPSDDELSLNPNIHVRGYWARIWWVRVWREVYNWNELDEIDVNVDINVDWDWASVEVWAE